MLLRNSVTDNAEKLAALVLINIFSLAPSVHSEDGRKKESKQTQEQYRKESGGFWRTLGIIIVGVVAGYVAYPTRYSPKRFFCPDQGKCHKYVCEGGALGTLGGIPPSSQKNRSYTSCPVNHNPYKSRMVIT